LIPKEETVHYEVRQSVAYITLNRPQALNAINLQLLTDLDLAFDRVGSDEHVRAVVIRGSGGRAFSAGVDLKEMQALKIMANEGQHLRFTARLRDVLLKVERAPVPVIAAIEGYALAGGLELALACDFILCTDDSQIGDQHANRFLIAGGGGTQRLPRRIGVQLAKELLFTGRRLSGQEAVSCGLALRCSPRAHLDREIERLSAMLRDKSRVCLRMTKLAVQRGMDLPLLDALEIERLIVQEYVSCYPDATDGVKKFNAKNDEAKANS
jgi:enoyl-CoA hydratase